jgi:small subunit ribosomal protein S4
MGDPKSPRRTYDKPKHPWQGDRIKAEDELIKKYGLKNKKELWKAQTLLRRFRQRSRELQAQVRYQDKQAEKERSELLGRLGSIGLLPLEGASLNDVLALDIEAILSRRFQTMAYVKGLAYSTRQSRQLIVHGHASIGDRKVTIPGYYVKRDEENLIRYSPDSPLANDLHPARPDAEAPPPPREEPKAEEAKEEKEEPKAKEVKEEKEEPKAKEAKEEKEEPKAKEVKEEKEEPKAEEAKEEKEEPKAKEVKEEKEEPKAEEAKEDKEEPKAEEAKEEKEEPKKEEK